MTTKKLWIAVISIAGAGVLFWSWIGRTPSEADDPNHSVAASAEIVAAVARGERRILGNTLTIAGEFKPFQDVDVHAKVAGYIKAIYVDVGDHVKEGQTLAVLEIPELAAELSGADAGVGRSQQDIRRAEGDLAVVVVATFYSGMAPQQIETNITNPFERFFTLASGVERIESRSLLA